MEVFLDSNIIYSDPFMESIYAQQLLKLAEYDFITIYMSSVVVDEIKSNYRKQINKEFGQLKKNIEILSKHTFQNIEVYVTLNKEQDYLIQEFDGFYKDLFERKLIHVLDYSNNILPELVNRSISRVKPFTDKKQEFRDAIIWLTYTNYAKENSLVDCHFITNNKSDFLEDGNIHKDLLKDSSDFVFYNSYKEFFSDNNKDLEYVRSEVLSYWTDELKYMQSDIFDRISYDYYDKIEIETSDFVDRNADYITINHELSSRGSLEPSGIDLIEINDYNVSLINNDIIISGSILVNQQFEIYEYNPLYEPGDEEYYYSSSDEVILLVEFTLKINTNLIREKLEELEYDISKIMIEDFEINRIDPY
ncbi:PIN domain-containing protein [Heyndrickxia oleronia]|uniref:PIN domain-containing protein n=1 Tax=Heyndrickxia oleronia TaxID=38875 RepID=UPI001C0ED99F|nr:PIN domain-containing protein [Heyndrickxia oleronia]MBU5214948.1 DUF4935 domain-containing protein [Heyndrickxia oleronia]